MVSQNSSGSPAGDLAGLPLREAREVHLDRVEAARQEQAALKRAWAARVWEEVQVLGSRLAVAQKLGVRQAQISQLLRDAGYPAGTTGRARKTERNSPPSP